MFGHTALVNIHNISSVIFHHFISRRLTLYSGLNCVNFGSIPCLEYLKSLSSNFFNTLIQFRCIFDGSYCTDLNLRKSTFTFFLNNFLHFYVFLSFLAPMSTTTTPMTVIVVCLWFISCFKHTAGEHSHSTLMDSTC